MHHLDLQAGQVLEVHPSTEFTRSDERRSRGRRHTRLQPDTEGGEFDAGEIVGRILVVAGSYCSEVFDLVEEAFDEFAVPAQE